MTKAHQALTLSCTTNTSLDNKLKMFFRLIASDDVIICFKDGSYLVYKYSKESYRLDSLLIETCQDDLPFCPLDLNLIDLSKE